MPRAFPSSLPFLAVAAGICTFSMMDATIKSAALQAGVYSTLLARSAIGTLMVLPFRMGARGPWPSPQALRIHALRGAVVAAMAVLFFYGLVRMPIAEGIALSFIAPLIALYLAALLLGETVRASAVGASLLGIAGVAVIAGARLGGHGTAGHAASAEGIAAVLCSAVLYAINLVLQRRQAQMSAPGEVALFQNLCVALCLLPAAPWFWHTPQTGALLEITTGAALATVSLMLLSWGYARAEAQALLPIEYSGFIWAVLFGWIWFGETVDAATIAGAVLIVAGCWIAGRNAGRPHGTPPESRETAAAP